MAKKKKPPYTVGYCKPPIGTQFKPGVSGNAKGRPKGSRNVRTILSNIMYEKIDVVENGKKKSMPHIEVMLRKVRRDAITGSLAACRHVTNLMLSEEERADTDAPQTQPLSRPEMVVINNLLKAPEKRGKETPHG